MSSTGDLKEKKFNLKTLPSFMLAHHLIFFSSSCLLSFVCKQMQTREKKMMMREASLKSLTAWRLTHILAAYLFLFVVAAIKIRVSQAVTKDLSSSSKFSGSCVLTLQTLQIKEKERRSVCVNTCQDPLRTSFLSSLWSLRCHLLIAEAIDDIMIKGKERFDEEIILWKLNILL